MFSSSDNWQIQIFLFHIIEEKKYFLSYIEGEGDYISETYCKVDDFAVGEHLKQLTKSLVAIIPLPAHLPSR